MLLCDFLRAVFWTGLNLLTLLAMVWLCHGEFCWLDCARGGDGWFLPIPISAAADATFIANNPCGSVSSYHVQGSDFLFSGEAGPLKLCECSVENGGGFLAFLDTSFGLLCEWVLDLLCLWVIFFLSEQPAG